MGSTPTQGTKMPQALKQLSPPAVTRESVHLHERSCMMQPRLYVPQLRPNTAKQMNTKQEMIKSESVRA